MCPRIALLRTPGRRRWVREARRLGGGGARPRGRAHGRRWGDARARGGDGLEEVRKGDLFFALRGRKDGVDFAPEAYLRGAVAAVGHPPPRGPAPGGGGPPG